MRITLQIEGGIAHFPGLARPRVFDTAKLPVSTAAVLAELIDKAQFFTRPEPPSQLRGADLRCYRIGVEEGDRERTLRICDPLAPELSALISAVRQTIREHDPG